MATLDPIYANPLAVRLITQVDPKLAEQLQLKPEQKSLGLLTADNDDATYVSIDEATKMADVEVVYAKSFYAGAKHSSGLLSGEIIAMLAGPDPAEVRAGL
ncbi:MAG: BMC domain-containing protein, partial [Chloroflexota bacterium]